MTPSRFHRLAEVLARRQPDLTVVLEDVRNPHNFSAIVRTCDAVGVLEAHAVTADGTLAVADAVAQGARRWLRVRTHASFHEAFDLLHERGLRVLAAHLDPRAVDFRAVDYTAPTAVLLGHEKTGVSPAAAARADGLVTVPMAGMVESLNVSVAAAVILYEAQRQRAAAGLYGRRRLDDATWHRALFEWAHPELAERCRRDGLPYPPLDADGRVLGPLPPEAPAPAPSLP